MKLKVKASARVQRQYLLLQAASKEVVEQALLDYLGVLGWARAAPVFISEKRRHVPGIILAVQRAAMHDVRAACELHSSVSVIRIAGTLKGLHRNL